MLTVYVADLANELFEIDNKVIPIGIGYVGSYCKERLGRKVDVHCFRTLMPLLEKLDHSPPDVVGFGCYDWNGNLTRQAAAIIKQRFPKCMIVMGGANAESNPEDNGRFLSADPAFDIIVYGDGEFPFANLVEAYIRFKDDDDPVLRVKEQLFAGTRALIDGEIVMGEPVDLVRDLSAA